MQPGKFITLEGGEGAGKSTQVKRLAEHLNSLGIKTLATREVGGCEPAEEIRKLWLSKEKDYWDSLSEVLLIMAARREHLVKTIWPALACGVWVISDRFVDSTRAYQGIGLDLGIGKIDALYNEIAGNFWPDLTLLLDLPVEIGLERVAQRRGEDDRYQQQRRSFHNKLREAFLAIAHQNKQRLHIIDAGAEQAQVAQSIQNVINSFIKNSGSKQ